MSTADRAAVTAAADRIDVELATNPLTAGESRGGTNRVIIDLPLSVLFRVDMAARTVHVVSVVASGRA